jgi:hypothetical protein
MFDFASTTSKMVSNLKDFIFLNKDRDYLCAKTKSFYLHRDGNIFEKGIYEVLERTQPLWVIWDFSANDLKSIKEAPKVCNQYQSKNEKISKILLYIWTQYAFIFKVISSKNRDI